MSTEAIPAPATATAKTRRHLGKELTKGIIIENPILIIMLGLCATLACSTSATDAFGMGIAFSFVMICSNVVVSLVRRITPNQIRIPVFITVISTFVTIVDYAMKAYAPLLSRSLGVFVPLIVVNCIVMGRAEAFASRNGVAESFMDGVGMSIGFTLIITLLGVIRELFGNGTIFGLHVLPAGYQPFLIFILPPGAFLVIGFMIAAQKKFFQKGGAR
ncbi:MAG TPA: electron transport complex subunit E [Anaerolineales bacterium]|nr:electron transport complex subunit E [Anaerolineales bacterium]